MPTSGLVKMAANHGKCTTLLHSFPYSGARISSNLFIMADKSDNLVLEHLRPIRATSDDHTRRFESLDRRMPAMEQRISAVDTRLNAVKADRTDIRRPY